MTQQEIQKPRMKPIWYFVGWVLGLIGLVILVAGLYNLAYPSEATTELAHLHPNIWWGGFMLICGIVFWWGSRNKHID